MPGRSLNNTERRLLERWNAGFGPSLRSIEITGGSGLRGLTGVTLDLRYPLVVLAGKNGTGKSTLLACAACGYHNTGPYVLWALGRKYFRLTDFFFTTPQENPPLDVQVLWTYRMSDGTIAIRKATKGHSRWSGYSGRPDRAVEFIGLLRSLHPSEVKALRRYFGTGVAPAPTSLESAPQVIVSRVLARNYQDVRISSSGRYSLHYLHAGATCYSGFNMGSGEDVACQMARVVHRLPTGSLFIIEEIETGLHPAAQRNLIRQLIDLCWEKRLQVICSSHSQAVLESVPAEARVLLVRHGVILQPRYRVSVGEAMSDMAELKVPELCIYVEDETARTLLLEALPAQVRQRVRVTTCGSWEDVIRFLATIRGDPALGCAVGILDGDRETCEADHLQAFQRYLGRSIVEDDRLWLSDRLRCLPGGAPPETYLRGIGADGDFRRRLASELKAEQSILDGFFNTPHPADHHSLFYDLAQRVGLDEDRVEIAMAAAAAHFRTDDFNSIVEFIQGRLAAETGG